MSATRGDFFKDGPETGPVDGFEEERAKILAAALGLVPFEGWTPVMLRRAAAEAGVDAPALAAAFPAGVGDLLAYWSAALDEGMKAKIRADATFSSLRIRDKVATAVNARLALLAPHKEAARRAAATLALPHLAPLAARLAWNTADAIWRALGDKSTDFNFYSKRAILTGVWTSTLTRWFGDDSADGAPTRDFLRRRIDNVMQFEKVKKKVRDTGFDPEGMFGWLARARYPGAAKAERPREAKVDEALDESFPASDPPYWAGGA